MNWIRENMLNSEINNVVLNDAPEPPQSPPGDWVKAYDHSKDS
jgi:hypothetical protein